MINILIKIIAMAFSVCGLGQYNKNKERGKIFAFLGLIFVGLAILLSVVFWAELFTMNKQKSFGISRSFFVYDASEDFSRYSSGVMPVCFLKVEEKYIGF